jgi:hypothetical protein
MLRRFEQPAEQPVKSDGFAFCPIPIPGLSTDQLSWQSAIYQIAWERALAEERPLQITRDLFAIMN